MFIVIKADIDGNYMRLCCDDRWRHFAHIGNTSECVKFYRHYGHAKRRCRFNGGEVVRIPNGFSLNLSGDLYDENDVLIATSNRHRYTVPTIKDYLEKKNVATT
jgi:hypothetical protein